MKFTDAINKNIRVRNVNDLHFLSGMMRLHGHNLMSSFLIGHEAYISANANFRITNGVLHCGLLHGKGIPLSRINFASLSQVPPWKGY